jgi:hypothetical protein
MGRPTATNPRRKQLNLSLTDAELARICERAAAVGMRPVHYGRALVLKDQSAAPDNGNTHTSRLYHQLVRLGNNLNQMVRHLHRTGETLPADLEPLLTDIRQTIGRLRR